MQKKKKKNSFYLSTLGMRINNNVFNHLTRKSNKLIIANLI